jgi:16S rRNA (cytosine967-C5)-methyltransferase
VAADLLDAVLAHHHPLDALLAQHSGMAALEPRDRAFARQLAATTLRRLGQIDPLIGRCLRRPLADTAAAAMAALRLGVCQLIFLGAPAHAVVDTAVSLARARGAAAFAGLVNAVLRRIARDGPAWAAAQDAARLNTPPWLWRSWSAAYGEAAARAIATAHLAEPPLDLMLRDPGDAAAWAERLGATVLPTGGLRLAGAGIVPDLPGFADGAWGVEDPAAALPVMLLGAVRGLTVLDLCAAPGGKTAQLAASGARVIAVDRSANRLRRLNENLQRLRLSADVIEADAASWTPPAPAGRVLLDVPCSATGTIRRHPDIARIKSAAQVSELAALQRRLLRNAAAMLAPGGVLVYCACSLQAEEGPDVVAAVLAEDPALQRVPVRPDEVAGEAELISGDGDLRTLPCHWAACGGLDGFYAARLSRTTIG